MTDLVPNHTRECNLRYRLVMGTALWRVFFYVAHACVRLARPACEVSNEWDWQLRANNGAPTHYS